MSDVLRLVPLGLFIFGFSAGLVYAVYAFIKTPREYRYTLDSSAYMKELLVRDISHGLAVEIKPQRKKAALRFLIMSLLLAFAGGPAVLFGRIKFPECEHFLGYNVAFLSFLYLCYGIPLLMGGLCLPLVRTGYSLIRTGFSPPLETVPFFRIISRRRKLARVRGYAICAFVPLFGLSLICMGHACFTELTKGRDWQDAVGHIEAKCVSGQTGLGLAPRAGD